LACWETLFIKPLKQNNMSNTENKRRHITPLEFFSMLVIASMLVMIFIYFLFL
jgi:hypothetical protein